MLSFCGIVSQGGLPFMSGQAFVFLLRSRMPDSSETGKTGWKIATGAVRRLKTEG